MQFGMERKLIKLIDEVSARASELSKIDERESKYNNKMQQNSSLPDDSGTAVTKDGGGIRFVPPEKRGIPSPPAKKVEFAPQSNDKPDIEASSKAIDSENSKNLRQIFCCQMILSEIQKDLTSKM